MLKKRTSVKDVQGKELPKMKAKKIRVLCFRDYYARAQCVFCTVALFVQVCKRGLIGFNAWGPACQQAMGTTRERERD